MSTLSVLFDHYPFISKHITHLASVYDNLNTTSPISPDNVVPITATVFNFLESVNLSPLVHNNQINLLNANNLETLLRHYYTTLSDIPKIHFPNLHQHTEKDLVRISQLFYSLQESSLSVDSYAAKSDHSDFASTLEAKYHSFNSQSEQLLRSSQHLLSEKRKQVNDDLKQQWEVHIQAHQKAIREIDALLVEATTNLPTSLNSVLPPINSELAPVIASGTTEPETSQSLENFQPCS